MKTKRKSRRAQKKDKLGHHVSQHSQEVMLGRLLAIDPASGRSSMPGWAVYDKGELVSSGIIEVDKRKPVQDCLQQIAIYLSENFSVDILAIEWLHKRVHNYAHWSIGAVLAAVNPQILFQVPPTVWRMGIDKDTYEKTDENDAIEIGRTVVNLAKEELRHEL